MLWLSTKVIDSSKKDSEWKRRETNISYLCLDSFILPHSQTLWRMLLPQYGYNPQDIIPFLLPPTSIFYQVLIFKWKPYICNYISCIIIASLLHQLQIRSIILLSTIILRMFVWHGFNYSLIAAKAKHIFCIKKAFEIF